MDPWSRLLLGVFILVPLAVGALPLGVLIGSGWCWWSESSSARRRLACGCKAKGLKQVEVRAMSKLFLIWDQNPFYEWPDPKIFITHVKTDMVSVNFFLFKSNGTFSHHTPWWPNSSSILVEEPFCSQKQNKVTPSVLTLAPIQAHIYILISRHAAGLHQYSTRCWWVQGHFQSFNSSTVVARHFWDKLCSPITHVMGWKSESP